MKVGNKLLRKLGYAPYAEVENMRDAWKTARDQADHDSKLCADLVIECQNQSRIVDELTTENDRLKETVDKQAYELGRLADDYTKLEEKLDRLKEKRKDLREYLGKIQDLTMAALGEDDWPKYPDD